MRREKFFEIGLLCLIFSSCLSVIILSSYELRPQYLHGTGEIEFYPIEGGFYGIISDEGTHYEPINLPDEFKIDGLQVQFILKLPKDSTSYHLWLKIVEIYHIEELGN
jgi:hypothetical protein